MNRLLSKIVALVISFWIVVPLGSFVEPERKWLVTNDSRLEISGSSNVNDFQCLNLSYKGNDTLYEARGSHQNEYLLNGVITLEATGFDCQNKLITNDFRKTVNAREYPEIKVRFLCLKIGKNASAPDSVKGQVEITMAGVSRRYDISCQFISAGKSKAHLIGEKTVRLSDFGLEPRPKMLGMIKVDDSVRVDFHLIIKSA